MDKILVIGACGQLGSELTFALRQIFGERQVVASDLAKPSGELAEGLFEQLNVTDKTQLGEIVSKHGITQIYHLAAILSAKGEQNPHWAWQINMEGLLNVLELAKEKQMHKIYWPSSIAVFGHNTPKDQTPQHTIMEPSTIYGISKQAGELWCQYYFEKYGVDARSLRYPGLIGYKSLPGGGTTDYAVDIYHQALETGNYTCFLKDDAELPMMYMPDALKATLNLMEAPAKQVKLHTSYNVAGMSFSPAEVAAAIRAEIPEFEISYEPDFRQQIAESWPSSIDDSAARNDWGWQPEFNLASMTKDMLLNLRKNKSEVNKPTMNTAY